MKGFVRRVAQKQQGFTLIELLVAIAITGVIIIGLSTTVFQLVAGNSKNSNAMTAVRNTQQVGHWVSQDILMANELDISGVDDPQTDGGTDILTIYWTQYTAWDDESNINSIKHKVTYNFTDDDRLIRYHSVDTLLPGGIPYADGFPAIDAADWLPSGSLQVAQHIEFIEISPSINQYVLSVTASAGGFQPVSESRTYDIKTRPD